MKWTAIHLGTHGDATGQLQYDTNPATWFGASNITGWRSSAVSNGVPPINLAFFDSCETGQSNTPNSILGPPGTSTVDRAAVAFTVLINAEASALACNEFYEYLQAGDTVDMALGKYIDEYNFRKKAEDVKLNRTNSLIFGDKFSRLVSVYTTSNLSSSPKPWYKVIS